MSAERVFHIGLAALGGLSVGTMAAALNDGLTMGAQADEAVTISESLKLVPPAPNPDVLREAQRVVPDIEARDIRPLYFQSVVVGDEQVVIVFPDSVKQRQAEFAAIDASNKRAQLRADKFEDILNQPTYLGIPRVNQDKAAAATGFGLLLSGLL